MKSPAGPESPDRIRCNDGNKHPAQCDENCGLGGLAKSSGSIRMPASNIRKNIPRSASPANSSLFAANHICRRAMPMKSLQSEKPRKIPAMSSPTNAGKLTRSASSANVRVTTSRIRIINRTFSALSSRAGAPYNRSP